MHLISFLPSSDALITMHSLLRNCGKKVKGFEDEDEAEVKCAFMSLWTNNTLGIPTYPVGMSWCNYYGDKRCFDEYINKWMPVFNAFEDWANAQR